MVGRVKIKNVVWWGIRSVTCQGRRCTRFWGLGDYTFTKCLKVFGSLGTNGGVVHFALSPFHCVGFLAETTLIVRMWQTSVTLLTRAKSIVRSVVGTTWLWVGRKHIITISVTRSERGFVMMRGFASVIATIVFLGVFASYCPWKKFLRSSKYSPSKSQWPWKRYSQIQSWGKE